MLDPSQLVAGATAVYGEEEIQRSYGTLVPVPAARLQEAPEGHVVDLAGRRLLCLDTPGHARHHLSLWDEKSRAFFPGDTFGLSYREFDTAQGAFILPTTTPVQFEPDALHASIRRMLSYAPQAMYLTHYSRVENVPKLANDLYEQIDAMVAIARRHAAAPDRHERIKQDLAALYASRAVQHGCRQTAEEVRELLAMDIELNAQGLLVWLQRETRAV
jgi:glyoxylase-like metal-dependent hydrolase (beta-lactamase superfamily II)